MYIQDMILYAFKELILLFIMFYSRYRTRTLNIIPTSESIGISLKLDALYKRTH